MRSLPLAAAAVALLVGVPVARQDLTGTWDISYLMATPRRSVERTLTVHLERDGSTLTGTAEMAAMGPRGGDGQTRSVEISDGQVGEGTFSFSVVMGGGPRSLTLAFHGSVEGDVMEGTLTTPRGGETPFTGKRR